MSWKLSMRPQYVAFIWKKAIRRGTHSKRYLPLRRVALRRRTIGIPDEAYMDPPLDQLRADYPPEGFRGSLLRNDLQLDEKTGEITYADVIMYGRYPVARDVLHNPILRIVRNSV